MAKLIVDTRDQRFVLHEILEVEKLCENEKYTDFSKDLFDMTLDEAEKLSEKTVFPTMKVGDVEGCKLEDGQVKVPEAYKPAYDAFCEGGWVSISMDAEDGGQGFPAVMGMAAQEWFMSNFAFAAYPGLTQGAARIIANHGTDEQKKKYLEKMVTGEWAGTMALTEPNAGSDVGSLKTKAIRQPDGTFRLKGNKIFITGGDHDLTENIIQPVLARIEGDPPGTKGISIFIMPKYLVNDDGSLGKRNDYEITSIEEKMGIHGSATCFINIGDNDDCYAELLGEEQKGMKVMFEMMNEMRIGVGMQGLASGSTAYLHALDYAKDRTQGSSIENFKDPEAPRVEIIRHPDVRRMLLWMKSHVEAMRALVYYAANCVDISETSPDEEERERYHGNLEVLTPIVKAWCTDIGFRVCEQAIQVYGGYGYVSEYPVEQFMRDEKIASIYEGTNGIQALDLVGRKLSLKKGAYFMGLLGEMNKTVERAKEKDCFTDLADDLKDAVDKLGEVGMFFAGCAKEGKFLVPIANAYPFLMMMGNVVGGWLLLWEACVAREKLEAIAKDKGVDLDDKDKKKELIKDSTEAAFYDGKVYSARYYLKNVLPEVEASLKSIKNEDLSVMEIAEESF